MQLIPALAPDVKRALLIGQGAGLMATTLRDRNGIVTDTLEIDPAVADAASAFFGFTPIGKAIVGDARYEIRRLTGPYDLIIHDCFTRGSELELAHEVLDMGVQYVDIPGFDDPSGEIWSAADQMILTAHALVLVIDVSTFETGGFTIDKGTVELLQQARDRRSAIFIVCNKAERLGPVNRESAEKHIRALLEQFGLLECLKHPPFFLSAEAAVNARSAAAPTPPNYDEFADALWESLWNTESIGLRRLYKVFEQLQIASEEVAALIKWRDMQEPDRVRLRAGLDRCRGDLHTILQDCKNAIEESRRQAVSLVDAAKAEFQARLVPRFNEIVATVARDRRHASRRSSSASRGGWRSCDQKSICL